MVQVSSGFGTFLALKSDGTVVAWGRESTGSIPLAARSGVASVSASDNGGRIAVKSDGTVVPWSSGSGAASPVPSAVQGRVTGAIAGSSFFLSWFTPASAPAITQQPGNLSVTAGQAGSFSAVASGDPAPSVQWQRAASGTDTYTDIPGATGPTYTTPAVAIADGGSRYRAVFSNGAGTATSDPATLTVVIPPAFTGGNAPTGTLGGAYWISYSLTGVPAPSVAVTGGVLPAGLSLAGAGVLSGTPTKAGVFPHTLTASNPAGTATSIQRLTINPATTGQAATVAPPASVQPGSTESDTAARIFLESANQILTGRLSVGGTTIPAGTKANSYYLHADPIGNANTAHPFA